MRPNAVTEKFLQSVWVTVVARLTILAMPLVVSFVTWFTYQIYSGIQAAIAEQGKQIIEMKAELLEHQFRLENGEAARLTFAASAEKQFSKLDSQLDDIAAKIAGVNDTVIRVQTIIETRLPTKEGRLEWPPR